MKVVDLLLMKAYVYTLTLLHSERPKLYTILVFLSAVGLTSLEISFVVIAVLHW